MLALSVSKTNTAESQFDGDRSPVDYFPSVRTQPGLWTFESPRAPSLTTLAISSSSQRSTRIFLLPIRSLRCCRQYLPRCILCCRRPEAPHTAPKHLAVQHHRGSWSRYHDRTGTGCIESSGE